MATAQQITDIARSVFDEAVPGFVEEVRAEDYLDESGAPAIEITALTRPGAPRSAALSTARNAARARLQHRLAEVGDARFAYIRFVSADEFDAPSLDDES